MVFPGNIDEIISLADYICLSVGYALPEFSMC